MRIESKKWPSFTNLFYSSKMLWTKMPQFLNPLTKGGQFICPYSLTSLIASNLVISESSSFHQLLIILVRFINFLISYHPSRHLASSSQNLQLIRHRPHDYLRRSPRLTGKSEVTSITFLIDFTLNELWILFSHSHCPSYTTSSSSSIFYLKHCHFTGEIVF